LQIEQHNKVKLGCHNIQGWICDDCFDSNNSQKESNPVVKDSKRQQQETIEAAKPSDVSPNTPKADEAGLS
jgi:hypothetical protein